MSRLFLVDDHTVMREGLRNLLRDEGHDVVGESGDPTIAITEIVRLQPDVVVLDLTLGERSGFEILAALTQRKSPSRVVMLTMSSQPRHVAEALRMGALGYVLKGAPASELLAAIEAVAAGRRFLAPEEADLAVRGLTETAEVSTEVLSPRQRQILVMVARGASSAEIGAELHLSPKTVDTYRSRLMAKLELGDVPAVVRWAIRHGLINADER